MSHRDGQVLNLLSLKFSNEANEDQDLDLFSINPVISSENLNNSACFKMYGDSTTYFKLKFRLCTISKPLRKPFFVAITQI